MSEDKEIGLTERTRNVAASFVVGLAVVHLFVPTLPIDGVFLGLLGLGAVIKLFDIHSVEALGVKAKARQIRKETTVVASVPLPELARVELPPVESVEAPRAIPAATEAEHREPFDLMPPVERVARLLWAVEQIRVELVILAATAGHLTPRGSWSHYRIQDLAPKLALKGIVPTEFLEPIRSVVDARNSVAHGEKVPVAVLESIDELAMTLLSRLRELPREYHRVVNSPVELYKDATLTTPHDFVGVGIEQRDHDGRILGHAVYPAVRQYTKGRFVTWNWDSTKGSDEEAWYLNASSGRAELAFSSANVFDGREFPEQWGIEYRAGGIVD
jgi:hypothetical protein